MCILREHSPLLAGVRRRRAYDRDNDTDNYTDNDTQQKKV